MLSFRSLRRRRREKKLSSRATFAFLQSLAPKKKRFSSNTKKKAGLATR
jgi:hypothetical protein